MNILSETEEAVFTFVKERVPSHKWKHILTRTHIEREMEDDDIEEIKEFVFDLVMNSLRWTKVVNDIQDIVEESEPEEETETESESDDDDRDW